MNNVTPQRTTGISNWAVLLPAMLFMLGSGGLLWASESTRTVADSGFVKSGGKIMSFSLPQLPYEKNALEPHISAETIEFHYGKHHNAYVTNLNGLIAGKPDAGTTLEEIIMSSDGPLFNNAAQVWNHTFYWHCMKPAGGGEPSGELMKAIVRDFGSYADFVKEFTAAATGQFGSGWAWLVVENGRLKVTKTGNADLPMKHGQTAVLTIDVWEHAYYIDFRNARPKYVETFLNHLVNWEFAAENFSKASK